MKVLATKTAILLTAISISVSAYSHDKDEDADDPKDTPEKAEANAAAPAPAAGGEADIGDQATDPTAPLMSLRLQNQYTASYRNADSYGNAGIFQAVIPVKMPFKTMPSMIMRFTMPYVTTPRVNGNRSSGMGDSSLLQLLVTDWLPKGQVFAWGPAWTIPIAGDNQATGSGQWQAGPAMVYMNSKTPKLQWGVLMFQQWDFAKARKDANSVSTLNIQPILTKHLNKGWYIAPPDVAQTYNFKTNTWTLALGGVVGRVFPVGGKPTQIYGGIYYNPIDKEGAVSSKWTLKFNWSFLLPVK